MGNKLGNYLWRLSLGENRNYYEQLLVQVYLRYKKLKKMIADKGIDSDSKALSKIYLHSRKSGRKILRKKFNFVTIGDLILWTNDFTKTFPTTFDIIIGIPRSGLLVANLIALKLGKPLSTPEFFRDNRIWASDVIDKNIEYKKVLLVEDTISTGETLQKNVQLLRAHSDTLDITTASLIVTKESRNLVDLYYKIISHPRLFEWNLLHAKRGRLAVDLDGVVCENCPPRVDADEKLYVDWIEDARPYLIPSFEIDAIITNRLEKYRCETEEWLRKYGVRYKELIMWNIDSKDERKGRQAQNKIDILLKVKPDVFWESSFEEAEQIWRRTKIPCLCVDKMILMD